MFDLKKGKTSDKVLTEQEIQQKLYGRFLSGKNTPAGASESFTRPASKPSSSSSAATLFPDETETELTPERHSSESISEDRPVEKKAESKEPAKSVVSKEGFREKNLSAENDLLRTVRSRPNTPKIAIQRVLPKIHLPNIPLKKFFEVVSNGLAVFFKGVFSIFFALGRVIDFRKESVRTGFGWGAGIVMLVLLLAAIQGLNAKREIAMKASVPKAPKKIAAKAVPKKGVVSPALSTQERGVSAPVADRNETPLSRVKEQVQAPVVAAEIGSQGRFVIQVATYVIRDDANRLLKDLKKIESNAFVKGLSRSSGKTYYSVFLGRFETFQAGQQALAKFKKTDFSKSFKDAFIRTLEAR